MSASSRDSKKLGVIRGDVFVWFDLCVGWQTRNQHRSCTPAVPSQSQHAHIYTCIHPPTHPPTLPALPCPHDPLIAPRRSIASSGSCSASSAASS